MTAAPDAVARDRITNALRENLFVDAGAGTGKTRQLVARVTELVATGALASIGSLAAITFTENAATELRTRIREALADAAGPASGRPGPQRLRCGQALAGLEDAAITTLHGFAARLLTDAPLDAGLPPAFEVTDAVSAGLDRDRWWRACLDGLLADPTLAPAWRTGLTLGLQPGDLRKLVEPFGANWDLLAGRSYGPVTLPPAGREALLEPLRALAAFAGRGPAGDRMTRQLDEVLPPLLAEAETEPDPLQVLALLAAAPISARCGNAAAWQDTGAGLEQARDLCQQLCGRRDRQLAQSRTAVATLLAERLRAAVLAHAEDRRRRGRLWFHDLLVLAARLLRGRPAVRAAMRERWRVILVDEFQDTDPVQVELVHLIAGEGGGSWGELTVAGGRLFFVGDPAQSIYRFRRAEVRLFTEVRAAYAATRVGLVRSFRSRPGVLAVVNAAFRELFADGQAAHADLHPARALVPGDPGPDVLLLGGAGDGPVAAVRDAEAAQVAATLRRARGEGWLVADPGGRTRPAGYADMAVLVPARTSLAQLEDALDRADVPFRVLSRSLVWESDAVRDLVTVLQAVDDPGDAAAVVAALRHPMFGCSDDDLVRWKAAGGGWRYDVPVSGELAGSPVAQAMAALLSYHGLRWWLPVSVLLDRIVTERRAVELTAAHRRPRDHWRRIRFLADQARAYADGGGSGLTGFIRWAREQITRAADVVETVTPERDDDAVQILTIHGAKGLEFPLVVLTGLNAQGGPLPDVVWQPGGPPAVRLRKGFETRGFTDAQRADRALDEQESLRLLYVGMTRAADHLVISLHHSPPGSGIPNCHAMRLAGLTGTLTAAGAVHEPAGPALAQPAASPPTPAAAEPGTAQPVASPPPPPAAAEPGTALLAEREQFLAGRARLLARLAATAPITATGLAAAHGQRADSAGGQPAGASGPEAAAGASQGPPGEGAGIPAGEDDVAAAGVVGEEPPDPLAAGGDEPETADDPGRRPVARGGVTLGSAVHRALELLDLTAPGDRAVTLAVAAACDELGVPRLTGPVAARVRSALRSPAVQLAAARPHWKEVPVVAHLDGRVVEGVIDLLVDTGDGVLIVDYKTDAVRTGAERAQRAAAYAPQLAAYASAVASTGVRVRGAVLCFAGQDSVTDVPVPAGPG